ncbi:MAG: NUDIX domain-containing protein, partial [Candidatus Nitrosothermus koennekii]
MREAKIATAFLEHNGSILILKRSKNVKTMRGKWAGISGYIENESPLDAAIREIKEETGIDKDKLRLLAKGDTIDVIDYENNTIWKVHPFLFYTYDTNIRL